MTVGYPTSRRPQGHPQYTDDDNDPDTDSFYRRLLERRANDNDQRIEIENLKRHF